LIPREIQVETTLTFSDPTSADVESEESNRKIQKRLKLKLKEDK